MVSTSFKSVVFEPSPEPRKNKFEVYGIVTTRAFQLSKCYVEKLHSVFPKHYDVPFINPMLDLDWSLFITKIRREIGGEKLWGLKKSVIILKNSDILGDDDDLLLYVSARYKLSLHHNYEKLGINQLFQYIEQQTENGNTFVYLTVSVDKSVIGSMLFEIYSRAVPQLSKFFLKMCVKKLDGFAGKPIQRIVRPSWIQCGGWQVNHYKLICENYVIPHDKRGVLSMCHNGKHTYNYSQFMISLEPTAWMDYKYVAFGQLIYGESILRQIENIPTRYEAPLKKVIISKCGLYDLCSKMGDKDLQALEKYLSRENEVTGLHYDVVDIRDAPSILLRDKYLKKYYSAPLDKTSHLPLHELPSTFFLHYVGTEESSVSHSNYQTSRLSTADDEMSQEIKQIDLTTDEDNSSGSVNEEYRESNQV